MDGMRGLSIREAGFEERERRKGAEEEKGIQCRDRG